MSSKFRKAERKHAKLRLALCGPSGSGKTYSALLIAQGISPNGKIALVDTEAGSGDLYANLTDYDIASLAPPFTPQRYINIIHDAETSGYDVLILDSLSHAWTGRGGVLEMHDNATSSSRSGNSYMAWREVTPQHNALVDAILNSNIHVIATMRTKTAYEIVDNGRGGKSPVKVGLAPIQREGMDFEFTVVLDLSVSGHMATATKDRTSLMDGRHFIPDVSTGEELLKWMKTGKAPAPAHPRPAPGSSLPQPLPLPKPSNEPSNEPKLAIQAKTRTNTDGEEYGMSADGAWFEAGGVRFNPDIFVMNPENKQPRYTKDGLFRVRRGKVQVAESLRAQSLEQPPAQIVGQPQDDPTPYTRFNPDRLDQATSRDECRKIYEEAVEYISDPELLKAWRTVYNANMVRLVSAE